MYEMRYLTEYYGSEDEDGRLRSRHGSVEYLTTIRYVDRYLRPGMRVLEIGAATGRYSLSLAARGFQVDAVELVEHNLNILKSNMTKDMNLHTHQGNALDLPMFGDETFDIVLLLGPMYHLYQLEHERQALREALRVTKTGGVLFAAYCIAEGTLTEWGFSQGNFREAYLSGMIDHETFACISKPEDLFTMHRKEDIDRLNEDMPIQRLHYVATDLFTRQLREAIQAMDEETFDLYLKYHFTVCERPDLVGATHHSLDVLRKI